MKQFLSNFEAIFFINRDQDTERCRSFLNNWEKYGIPLHRVDAVTPNNMDINTIILSNRDKVDGLKCRIRGVVDGQKQKEASCSLSHAKALSEAKRLGLNKFIIMEDDSIPNPKFNPRNPNLYESKGNNVLITYLNYLAFTDNCGTKLTSEDYSIKIFAKNDDWAVTEGGIFSTSAYGVDLSSISSNDYNGIVSDLTSGVIADYYFSEVLQNKYKCVVPRIKVSLCDTNFDSTIGENYKGINDAYENDVYKEGYVYGSGIISNKIQKYLDHKFDRAFLTVVLYPINNGDKLIFGKSSRNSYIHLSDKLSEFNKITLPDYYEHLLEEAFITVFLVDGDSYKTKLEVEYVDYLTQPLTIEESNITNVGDIVSNQIQNQLKKFNESI